jgi:hypothetical protein
MVMDFVTEVIMEVVRDENGSLWWLMMVEEVSYGGFGGGWRVVREEEGGLLGRRSGGEKGCYGGGASLLRLSKEKRRKKKEIDFCYLFFFCEFFLWKMIECVALWPWLDLYRWCGKPWTNWSGTCGTRLVTNS